jgi:RNA polymerase sigma factor (sigma-70 family)
VDIPSHDYWFEQVVRETHHGLRSAIASMGVPVEDVDDVAQEVYLDLATAPERLPPGVELKRWLHGMARNCAYEYFRRRSRQHRRLVAMAGLLEQAADPVVTEPVPAVDALMRCLQRLQPNQRRLLEQHYRDGRPIAELANEEGRMATAMHMVFSRLRDVLRRCIERESVVEALPELR